jgi:hypothetical protein
MCIVILLDCNGVTQQVQLPAEATMEDLKQKVVQAFKINNFTLSYYEKNCGDFLQLASVASLPSISKLRVRPVDPIPATSRLSKSM